MSRASGKLRMSALARTWFLSGMACSVVVTTGLPFDPFRVDHYIAFEPSAGQLLLQGLAWALPVTLVLAAPVCVILRSWTWLAAERAPLLETNAPLRLGTLTLIALSLPKLMWLLIVAAFTLADAPMGPLEPWTWRFPFATFRIDVIWVAVGVPALAWLLLPRLLIPALRGPLARNDP